MACRAFSSWLVAVSLISSCALESECVQGYELSEGRCVVSLRTTPGEDGGLPVDDVERLNPCEWPQYDCEDCIVDYRNATFDRSSSATLWLEEAQCFLTYEDDQLRMYRDGSVHLEGQRTNRVLGSNLFDAGAWDESEVTVGRATTLSPFGPGAAWDVAFLTDDSWLGQDVWLGWQWPPVRTAFSAFHGPRTWGVQVLQDGSSDGRQQAPSTDWRREIWDFLSVQGTPEVRLLEGVEKTGEPHRFFGVQVELGFFPSQYIDTPKGSRPPRRADELVLDVLPAAMRYDWQVEVQPAFSRDDLRDMRNELGCCDDRMVLFDFNDGDLQLSFDVERICLRTPFADVACSSAID